ncbi:MAG TPA: hypothetical protein VGX00_01955 [Thermoplasmata archaeon]|nr:hypothetical protein [Thermoplasmata archaeon]
MRKSSPEGVRVAEQPRESGESDPRRLKVEERRDRTSFTGYLELVTDSAHVVRVEDVGEFPGMRSPGCKEPQHRFFGGVEVKTLRSGGPCVDQLLGSVDERRGDRDRPPVVTEEGGLGKEAILDPSAVERPAANALQSAARD